MLVSGGVDSTVCAALLHKALKDDQVIALHVDNGFMRKNESRQVVESLNAIGVKLRGNTTLTTGVVFRRISVKIMFYV